MMNGVKCMNATQIIESMNDLKQTIYNEIHHRILLRYTGQPILKDEKLFFILLPFLNGVEYDEAMQTGAVSVGIVQASLDEHEKIKESNTIEKSRDEWCGRH